MTKKATEDRLLVGNCLDTLKTLADDSIDSIVTDPPYEIGFMGKGWDSTGIAYSVELWKECLRVLKPGGHLLSFGATRSYHRMAVAIEDAGFEIRDSIHWTYGSGFPKSMNISKAIDKAAGAEGKVVGEKRFGKTSTGQGAGWNANAVAATGKQEVRAPATEAAKKWNGWGTALKPSHEPIVVARKPINQTVADNVQQYGTGAINIDATRIGGTWGGSATRSNSPDTKQVYGEYAKITTEQHIGGRFPANTLLTHNHDCDTTCTPNCPIELLDQQQEEVSRFFHNSQWSVADDLTPFIYQAKPGKKERNAGLGDLPQHKSAKNGSGFGRTTSLEKRVIQTGHDAQVESNFHPTVKPVELIRYLIKLVTPPKGTVLDPFLGSGTTAVAAILEGVEWKGCELTEDYLPIIEGRTAWATKERKKKAKPKQTELFE